jgi:hypothetical protein
MGLGETRRFSGAARAAAALIGIRIAAGRARKSHFEPREDRPPDWLSELDEYEDADVLSRALYSPLDEMIEARIAPEQAQATTPAGTASAFACPAGRTRRRVTRNHAARRGTCPRTRL